jgi:hypothetical protein
MKALRCNAYVVGIGKEASTGYENSPVAKVPFVNLLVCKFTLGFPILCPIVSGVRIWGKWGSILGIQIASHDLPRADGTSRGDSGI